MFSDYPLFALAIGGGAVLALLLGLKPAGAHPSRAASAPSDSLSAADVTLALRYDTPPPPSPSVPPRDRWWARDKVRHVAFSGLWTLSTQYVLVQKADWAEGDALSASVASAAVVGLTKELYDASRLTSHFCSRDLVADAVGIGLAAGLILL